MGNLLIIYTVIPEKIIILVTVMNRLLKIVIMHMMNLFLVCIQAILVE